MPHLGDVLALIDRYTSAGVTLTDRINHGVQTAQWLRTNPVPQPEPVDLLEAPTNTVLQRMVDQALSRGLANDLGMANTTTQDELRAALQDALIEHADDALDQLRPTFDAAVKQVRAAVAAGIRPHHTSDAVIDLGDKAVRAWRHLAQATATLDDLGGLRIAQATMLDLAPHNAHGDIYWAACFTATDLPWHNGRETFQQKWLRLAHADDLTLHNLVDTAANTAAIEKRNRRPLVVDTTDGDSDASLGINPSWGAPRR
ncbi:hypothetical protein GCM10028777_24960 [Angustibacter speluncae]